MVEMVEPTFLGITKSEWELVNSFANWIAAIGTVAAVWVSLLLANRIARPKADVSVGHRLVLQPGSKGPAPEFIVFRVVNTGERPIRITQIGWRVGLFKKRYAVQMHDAAQSNKLPVDLEHGQEAQWFVPLDARQEPWLVYFARGMLTPNPRISLLTLRGQVFTSLGTVFEVWPEPTLRKKLRDASRGLTIRVD